jgi:3-oxoacyl-[acyl-carrier-protein] synthase II
MNSTRRVVVTGMGIISSLGNEVETAWQNILAGKSGVSLIEHYDVSNCSTKIASLVKDFNPEDYGLTSKDARKMDDFIQYGYAASVKAIADSGLDSDTDTLNMERIGVAIGSGIGGLGLIEKNHDVLNKSGPRRVSPFFIPGAIINLVSGHVSIKYGFQGPNLAFATACTTGCHAIGMAARNIVYGDADVMVAGGTEKASTPLGMAGFSAARALSTRNDEPEKASRPFDKDRDGFVLGDGAGVVVLEELEHAKARGAKIYAELVGFGMSADAFHITQPSEGGKGAAASINNALKDAKLNPEDIDYINSHGTSTPVGDIGETLAVKAAFGEHAKKLAVSSTKSMTGHLLGAAGAVEVIYSILSLRDKIAPPTINLDNPSEGCDLDYVAHTAREMDINIALSNSFGFGGTNGTIILKRFD